MNLAIRPRQRLVFAGDSITDCHRRDTHAPLGDGFVHLVHDLLIARSPALRPTILNAGFGGNTIRDLAARWDAEVIAPRPHWVTVLIGVNDAWGYLIKREKFVSPQEYREIYSDLLVRLRRRCRASLVLMDPFLVGKSGLVKDDHQGMLDILPQYRAVVAAMAKQYSARHVRLQKVFDTHLRYRPALELAPDAIHPTRMGHAILAHAWLKSMANGLG